MLLPTKEKIVQAALKLFAQKGFEATSIRDIAQEAEVNSSTLYYYIKNKEDFLTGIMKSGLERIITNSKEVITKLDSPEKRIASIVQLHVMAHGVNQLSSLVTDTEFRSLNSTNKEIIRNLRKTYENIWFEVIVDGTKKGIFTNVKNPKMTTLAALSMCTGIVNWYSSNGKSPLLEISNHFVDMVLCLLGAEIHGRRILVKDLNLPDPTFYYNPNQIENDEYLEVLKKK